MHECNYACAVLDCFVLVVQIIVGSFTSCFVVPESVGGLQWLVWTRQFGHDNIAFPGRKREVCSLPRKLCAMYSVN